MDVFTHLCRGIKGPLVADAYIAALAIEHGFELITTDGLRAISGSALAASAFGFAPAFLFRWPRPTLDVLTQVPMQK